MLADLIDGLLESGYTELRKGCYWKEVSGELILFRVKDRARKTMLLEKSMVDLHQKAHALFSDKSVQWVVNDTVDYRNS